MGGKGTETGAPSPGAGESGECWGGAVLRPRVPGIWGLSRAGGRPSLPAPARVQSRPPRLPLARRSPLLLPGEAALPSPPLGRFGAPGPARAAQDWCPAR